MFQIDNFSIFLFDFDGLLVDTESLHFLAYKKLCESYGCHLDWSIEEFFKRAHKSSTALKEALFLKFPSLKKKAPSWDFLYKQKKEIYDELLSRGKLELMPGVEPLLKTLEALGKKRAVVTNSPKQSVDFIKERLPLLNSIPLWLTREAYNLPKPAPDGYLKALSLLGNSSQDRSIGFEDSLRGYQALVEAKVSTPILICHKNHPQLQWSEAPKTFFTTMNEVFS